MNKLLSYVYVLSGVLVAIVGASFIFMYVWEAIILRTGDPDQSLLFWYLPVLFLGLIGISAGLALTINGVRHLGKFR